MDGSSITLLKNAEKERLYASSANSNIHCNKKILFQLKCDDREDIYNYLMQELRPTLDDLGLSTVEEMGLHEVED